MTKEEVEEAAPHLGAQRVLFDNIPESACYQHVNQRTEDEQDETFLMDNQGKTIMMKEEKQCYCQVVY